MRLPIKAAVFALLAAALLPAAEKVEKPRVARALLATMEKGFDDRVKRSRTLESFELLGTTRGVYLDNYGVVFSAEVSLSVTPWATPMSPALTPADIVALRAKKLERIPSLKQMMREMLMSSASGLDMIPATEQVVLAVSLFYFSFENKEGLPAQIVMQAPRQVLLDLKDKKAAPEAVRVEEY